MNRKSLGQLSKCLHSAEFKDRNVGAVSTPVFLSSAYRIPEGDAEFCYPRYLNVPNQKAAADTIAALENGPAALVMGSGMAAVTSTLLALLKAGDHAVFQADIYGGTYHFVVSEMARLGIETTLVSGGSIENFTAAVKDNTRLIYFETPNNPLLRIVDIRALADEAGSRGLLTVIDNTFATPLNQKPLDLGVDVVIHSGTKYLGGHSDLCCGAVVAGREIMDRVYATVVNHGGILGGFEAYLLERSLKTLGVRMRQHNRNAQALAEFLSGHPRVGKVHYPGLPQCPGHEIAARQMSGFGGMLSVELKGGHEEARRTAESLKLFVHAVSLGGAESMFCFPVLTSHAKMTPEERGKMGITDSLVRVSVGIEDTDDLIEDWRSALG